MKFCGITHERKGSVFFDNYQIILQLFSQFMTNLPLNRHLYKTIVDKLPHFGQVNSWCCADYLVLPLVRETEAEELGELEVTPIAKLVLWTYRIIETEVCVELGREVLVEWHVEGVLPVEDGIDVALVLATVVKW